MSNPTSNYSWQMPTATDLVTDLPADFEVFGQAVDTTTKNLNPATTLGDIQYRSSTANTNTRLAIGSSGQILTVSSGVPAWLNPAAKVLQVVSTAKSDTFVSSSTSFVDITGLSVSITPSSATSNVFVMVTLNGTSASSQLGFFKLLRDSTDIAIGDTASNRTRASFGTILGNANQQYTESMGINFLDNPATTSATTYKVQLRSTSGNICINRSGDDGDFSYYARTISSITVMEIGA